MFPLGLAIDEASMQVGHGLLGLARCTHSACINPFEPVWSANKRPRCVGQIRGCSLTCISPRLFIPQGNIRRPPFSSSCFGTRHPNPTLHNRPRAHFQYGASHPSLHAPASDQGGGAYSLPLSGAASHAIDFCRYACSHDERVCPDKPGFYGPSQPAQVRK